MIKDLLNYNTPISKGDRQKYGFDFGTSSEISGEKKGENGQYTIKCPMLMKKFSSLRQKALNNAKESLRHRIKSYKLQIHLYIRNLQI